MSKKMYEWLFPSLSLLLFVTLLGAMLLETNTMTMKALISYSTGLLAFTMMLVVTFIGSRPRFIEKNFGMPEMYEVHALMSVVLSILIVIHMLLQWGGFRNVMNMSIISQTGFIAVVALIIVMFTGIFSLSGIFVSNNKKLREFKETKLNREINLWLHRLAIVSIIAVYFHLYFLPFLQQNVIFMTLLNIYTIATLGYYAYWKIKVAIAPEFKVSNIYRGTPSLWVIEFEPVSKHILRYTAGDYFFIRFIGDANITKEGHPFSTSSAITSRYKNSIEFMIKEAGDWTGALQNIKVGDKAKLEGPYGHFLPEKVEYSNEEDVPFILLAGGIGLTPNLSVLRHEIEKKSQRRIILVWGLSYKEDMFMLDELDAMKEVNPNFSYHIIFSNEEVEGYPFGFISDSFLREIGAAEFYQTGEFFVCGPPAMLNATRTLIKNANIPEEHVHLDDFGF
ncbi:ferredoxin reductase family protein [Fundicoccus sp. Sow4_H7]|uniref:ferredoxin reductase family protein n=1 Tax=Fundicoccus sp. Sow4_H7 TaxID=3438784 RepID=UPI003F92DAAB